MNLLDRFMSLVPMKRQQLQLLGTVCLLLSSKLKESPPLDAHKLVDYAAGAFKLEDLRVSIPTTFLYSLRNKLCFP